MKTNFINTNKLPIMKNIPKFNFCTNTNSKNLFDRTLQLEKDASIKKELKPSNFVNINF